MSIEKIEWIEGRPPEVKAGMLLEMDDGERFLVGDINEQGGCCDCCSIASRGFAFESEIVKYAVVCTGGQA